MPRRQDWPERLAEFLEERRGTPFAWVTNDCCSFAADAIERMTDQRPELPAYASMQEAAELLHIKPLLDRVDAVMGPMIATSFAQRGDLAMIHVQGRDSLGIMLGEYIAVPGDTGLLTVPRQLIIAAWSV